MSREEAISGIIDQLTLDDVVISTTGKASRELYDLRNRSDKMNKGDFLMVGSMGHASSIALGVALQESERNIYCIDGDGALIMHMGALSTIGKYSTPNFRHILLNNFSHESVGGQESSSDVINYSQLSTAVSYKNYFKISKKSEFKGVFGKFQSTPGPSFLEIIVDKGSKADLSRPDFTPSDNKKTIMEFLGL
jgi:phosphonopyruvate decarboxylase